MAHLVIAGHGMRKDKTFDPGASGLIKKGEHRYVKEDLFPAMKRHLPKGANVVFFDEYNVFSHGNIVALAKKYKATEVTEIHFDAAGPSASGGHVIVYKGYSPDKTDLAFRDAIDNVVGVFSGYNHKGHKGVSGRDNLFNVNATAKAGITYRMLELGFGTNKHDADILVNKVDDYAKELVKVIVGKVSDKPASEPKPSQPSKKPSKPKDTTNKANLVVDGYWGKVTTRALQKYFNLIVDGVISGQYATKTTRSLTQNTAHVTGKKTGSPVIRSLQKKLKVTQDGLFGPATVKALQKHLGTPVDGKISKPSPMVKELQKRLNKGQL